MSLLRTFGEHIIIKNSSLKCMCNCEGVSTLAHLAFVSVLLPVGNTPALAWRQSTAPRVTLREGRILQL